ncbi:rhodanese-related sulfurtransferase [Rhodococcus olei]|uniref:tRNA uridine(34) hydroxylase n=1 Tax=Rhodococcus olei TaxID=2161675 RepID=A0ABP8NY23_9NOCA
MSIPKIVLFYRFTPLADPEAIRLWQYTLASANGLTGRILVSEHGINATVGGDVAAVKRYVRGTREYAPFADADIKWSDGTGADFPRLSVKVRPEIVTFGAPDELHVDAGGVVGGGAHLSPTDLHDLVDRRGDEVVFFDGRNAFEAEIGRFRGAVVPDVATTRDFVSELDSGRYDHLKAKPVVTYCTGGVRCEVLSALMRRRGFEEVYQLDGGIVRYGETFGDDGLWDGSLYVFDGRGKVEFSDHAAILGRCTGCGAPTSRHVDHNTAEGRARTLLCTACVPDA